MANINSPDTASLYRWASALSLITIFYNIIEGVVSIFFGLEDETIALFGFGVDSFVEVISGTAFYLLAIALILTSSINLYQGHSPETTSSGIVIAAVSILTMWALMYSKIKVGKELNSHAILADAACTKTCIYLSIILLLSSIGFELTGFGGLDSIGAIGIAWLSFKEEHEAFQKTKGKMCCCC